MHSIITNFEDCIHRSSLESEEDRLSGDQMVAALQHVRSSLIMRSDDKSLDIRSLYRAEAEVFSWCSSLIFDNNIVCVGPDAAKKFGCFFCACLGGKDSLRRRS